MAAKILAVVEDIFFLAKIQQTARQLGIAVESVGPDTLQERLAGDGACAILLDLNHRSGKAIAVLEGRKRSRHARDSRGRLSFPRANRSGPGGARRRMRARDGTVSLQPATAGAAGELSKEENG